MALTQSKFITFVYALHIACLWAMLVAVLLTRWTWLEMRFNIGWIFFGVWAITSIVLLFIRKSWLKASFVIVNTVICLECIFLACGNVGRISNLPACLVREGLLLPSFPIPIMNGAMCCVVIAGFVIAAVDYVLQDKAKKEI